MTADKLQPHQPGAVGAAGGAGSGRKAEPFELPDLDISVAVAVVTGGASGIGKGIAAALLRVGATVTIADVEAAALESAVAELPARFDAATVDGSLTEGSDPDSTEALAERVFGEYGRCNLLFNNAGVTSGGGGLPWEQEHNDWRWCFGVNVFGVANGVNAFVPRMIASGEPGQVVNTSSGDGGFAPVPRASVYASSKAAVSCYTEALHHTLIAEGARLRASVFYPSGGLMPTGLFNAARNRPTELARVRGGTGRVSMSFEELRDRIAASGHTVEVADLEELGDFVVDCVRRRQFIIARDIVDTVDLLHRRAEAIGRFEAPPHHDLGF